MRKNGLTSWLVSVILVAFCVCALGETIKGAKEFTGDVTFSGTTKVLGANEEDGVLKIESDAGRAANDRWTLTAQQADNDLSITVGGTEVAKIDTNGNLTVDGTISGTPAAGTDSGATITSTETYGTLNKTVLTVANLPVVIDGTAAGTNGYGSALMYTFPAGRIAYFGFLAENVTNSVGTGLDAADGGDFAVGSAAATLGDTLTGTEANFLQSTSVDPIVTSTDAALSATPTAQLDGTSTAAKMYYNIVVDDGDISAVVTNTTSGTYTFWWINLGDY